MLSFLLRRLNLLLITAFILTIVAFLIDRNIMLNFKTPELPQSSYVSQYLDYLLNILKGNLGYSEITHLPFLQTGLINFASTIELCFVALIFSSLIAIPLGVLAGLFRNSTTDYIIMTIALSGLALPVFWVSVMAILLPSFIGNILPIDGNISVMYEIPVRSGFLLIDTLLASPQYGLSAFCDRIAHLILPASVLSLFLITEIIRLTRHSMTMVMRSNYIKAAYAKGFSRSEIVFNHALRNALPAVIPQLRLQMSTILSFAMVIEIVFNLQGIGAWLLTSLQDGDYLALPAGMLIVTGFILFFSILTEILMVIISPLRRGSLYVD